MKPELKKLQSQIEESYPRPIRLEKTKKKRKETLREFLVLFFTEWNNEKNTIYVDNKEVQTDTKRRRSLGDIYMICKYYYPDTDLEAVLHELLIGLREHFPTGFRTSYCNTIFKRVWYYSESRQNGIYNQTKYDEYGNPYRFYMAFFVDTPEEVEDFDEDEIDDGEDWDEEDDEY